MTDTLARSINGPTAPTAAPLDAFQPLDIWAGGLSDEPPRLDALATISAGDRGPTREKDGRALPGLPRRSTDGTITLHDATGRAPGLRAALEAAAYKTLTVAFPWDDPTLFIQQRFTRYSASALEVYGDQHTLHLLDERRLRTVMAGSDEYRQLLDTCSVSVSVYFMLAEWAPQPAVVLPDGLGFYRLRFTSRNSLRSILNGLRAVGRFTGSRVAGVPFELRIDYREVADRTGQRRTVPVWVLVMRPPATVRLSSQNWAAVMQGALSQGQAFKQLPPPGEETLALAEWEGPEPDLDEATPPDAPSDADIGAIAAGGPVDARYWERRWFAIADGTRYDLSDDRAAFIADWTAGRYASLAHFLEHATEGDCEALIAELQAAVSDEEFDPRRSRAQRARGQTQRAADTADDVPDVPADDDEPSVGIGPVPAGRGWGVDPSLAEREAASPRSTPSAAVQSLADAAEATVVAPTPPPKRHGQKALNAFFAQLGPLRPRPTPADIHRILGVDSIQEVVNLDVALRALLDAWRSEHPPEPVELDHPANTLGGSALRALGYADPQGSIEAEWARYTAARDAARAWNREYPEQAITAAEPPRDATAVQVRAYAEGLERRLAKLAYAAGGGE